MNNCAVSMNAPGVIRFLCRAQWRFSQIAIPAIGYAEWPAAFAFGFSNIAIAKRRMLALFGHAGTA
jgi:hypothetical protein